MLVAISLWTYTVVRRSQRLEERMAALESVNASAATDVAPNDEATAP